MVRKLLYLNGLAILGVVLFHVVGTGFVAMFAWGHRYLPSGIDPASQIGSTAYYALRIFEQLAAFSIQGFLIVSGYFVAVATGRDQATIRWQVVFSRIRHLLVPYLIWTAVVLGLKLVEGKPLGGKDVLEAILFGKANEVLYFVPLLVQFYLLAPWLVTWARRNWKILLLTTGLLQLAVQGLGLLAITGVAGDFPGLAMQWIPKWLFLGKIFWFPMGIVLGFYGSELRRVPAAFFRGLWVAAFVLIPLGVLEWEWLFRGSGLEWLAHRETILDSLYALAVVFALLYLEPLKLPLLGWISSLGAKSFGIYLTHAVVIEYTARLVYHFQPRLLGVQALFTPLLFVAGLGLPLLLMWVVNRSPFRRYYGLLFG